MGMEEAPMRGVGMEGPLWGVWGWNPLFTLCSWLLLSLELGSRVHLSEPEMGRVWVHKRQAHSAWEQGFPLAVSTRLPKTRE